MREETTESARGGYWTSHPSLEQVKRLGSGCHRVALPAGSGEALIAILDEEHPDPLVLRVAAARLCQTPANIRGHLSGGRRLHIAAERSAR